MLAMARRFEGGMTLADDIVQEASLVAMSLVDKAASVSAPPQVACGHHEERWVARVEEAECQGASRQSTAEGSSGWFGEDPTATWQEAMALSGLKCRVMEAIVELPPKQRNVVLDMLNGMEDDEIAAMEGVAESTVRVRRHRAVRKMRQALAVETNVLPSAP